MEFLVRNLTEKDIESVRILEDISDWNIVEWLECENTVWGVYHNLDLVGFCTVGYAEACGDVIENYPNWTSDSLLLSNVFVLPKYRHLGAGTKMVQYVLDNHPEVKGNLVFLTIVARGFKYFYKRLGFKVIDNGYTMVKHC